MLQADRAKVEWNSAKKHWEVQILVGAEVIKRTMQKDPSDSSEAVLREMALEVARDEGYEVAPEHVEVHARVSA